ncbi:MAG: type II toxin-antitoxin system RelB/DinJ family antitoxin [Parvibaculales bacterium]
MNTETIRARVEPEVKHSAENIFKELGISASAAISMFYRQVAFHKGLPFSVHIPNEETRKAVREAKSPEKLKTYKDFSEIKKELGI